MQRQTISLEQLRAYLIDRTTDFLRRDARFIHTELKVRQRDGTPNWDANIGIAPPKVLEAFADSLAEQQREFDVAW
jgi:hypothetical protein